MLKKDPFVGVNLGLASMPATVYAAEVSSPKIRGMLTAVTSVSIALGVLLIYVLSFFFSVSDFYKGEKYNFLIILIFFSLD